MIIGIVGRSASGKDTIANHIKEKYDIPIICSHTTRPMRYYETNGKEHWFNTRKEMDELLENKDNIIAYTKFDVTGYEYCATLEDYPNEQNLIYIIDPNGIDWLKANRPNIELKIIHVTLPEDELRRRGLDRGDIPALIEKRMDSEREQFSEFSRRGLADLVVNNFDLDATNAQVDEFMDNFINEYSNEYSKDN